MSYNPYGQQPFSQGYGSQQRVPYNPAVPAPSQQIQPQYNYNFQQPQQSAQYSQPQPQPQQQAAPDYFGSINQQLGMQLGTQAIQQGEQMVKENINKYISVPHLKYYFNVSNSYVLYKIRLLLFPFRHKSWSRIALRSNMNGQFEGYKGPREDLNAPDLYIPVMSFVTYVLMFGILLGSKNTFTPDVLGMTSTTSLFIVFLEVMIIKTGLYLLSIPTEVPILDLVSYCGYKYVGIIVTLLAKIVLVSTTYVYLTFGYTMLSFGFFLLRSLKYIVFPEQDPTSTTSQNQAKRRRVNFLFIIAFIQVCLAWLMI